MIDKVKIFWQILSAVSGGCVAAAIALFAGAPAMVIGVAAAAGVLISGSSTLLSEYFNSLEQAQVETRIAAIEQAASDLEAATARRVELQERAEANLAAAESRSKSQQKRQEELVKIYDELKINRQKEQDANAILKVAYQELEQLRVQSKGDVAELRVQAEENTVTLPEAAKKLKVIEDNLSKSRSRM